VVTTHAPTQLGFLTVLQEPSGFVGGYLVTNLWGRPIEFRLSTAVQPNRVQQILYGPTLSSYVHGEVIGRALIEKTATAASLVLTDKREVLDLRNHIDLPIAWITKSDSEIECPGAIVRSTNDRQPAMVAHPRHPGDLPRIREIAEQLEGLDLTEPFMRICDAIAEARKLGVASRG